MLQRTETALSPPWDEAIPSSKSVASLRISLEGAIAFSYSAFPIPQRLPPLTRNRTESHGIGSKSLLERFAAFCKPHSAFGNSAFCILQTQSQSGLLDSTQFGTEFGTGFDTYRIQYRIERLNRLKLTPIATYPFGTEFGTSTKWSSKLARSREPGMVRTLLPLNP